MKKAGLLLIFLALLSIRNADALNLIIDNKKLNIDTEPVIRNATVYVPLRGVFEELKASVVFDKKTSIIRAFKKNNKVVLKINSTVANINGAKKIMPFPPFILNNRAMVPLRFVTESLGCDVKWSPSDSSVYIYSRNSGQEDTDIKDFDVDI